MKSNIKVSVGIPAYNESNNIKNVLKDILSQRRDGWRLAEVLVFDDGSTDGTVMKMGEIKDKLIKIHPGKKRCGKTYRLNQMFSEFGGNILVMFDGDIRIVGKSVITKIVKAFESDDQVMLVGGNSKPMDPLSFFQRSVYSTFSVFNKSRKAVRGGNNIFGCTGSILAIKKELAKSFKIPKVFNEDAYIYFYCLQMGYKFLYEDNAQILYKLPTNLSDYLRQLFRSNPAAVDFELKKYFGNLVEEEFKRPLGFYIKSVIKTFVEQPAEVLFIVAVNIISKPFYPVISRNYKLSWFTASSTH